MESYTIPTYTCKSCKRIMEPLQMQRYQGMYSILLKCNCGKKYRTHVKVEGVGKVVYQAQMK